MNAFLNITCMISGMMWYVGHTEDENSEEEVCMDNADNSEEAMDRMETDKLLVYSGLSEAQSHSIYTQNLVEQLTGVES